jgi:exopolyphosphatase
VGVTYFQQFSLLNLFLTVFSRNIKQTIEPVGSCATLIGEIVLTGSAGGTVNATIAALLRQTIILDTMNFSPLAKKTTPKDEIMVKELEMADCLGAAQSRSLVFSNLIQAKSDVSGLSTIQLLKKDLKVLRVAGLQVAVSSIPVLVKVRLITNEKKI